MAAIFLGKPNIKTLGITWHLIWRVRILSPHCIFFGIWELDTEKTDIVIHSLICLGCENNPRKVLPRNWLRRIKNQKSSLFWRQALEDNGWHLLNCNVSIFSLSHTQSHTHTHTHTPNTHTLFKCVAMYIFVLTTPCHHFGNYLRKAAQSYVAVALVGSSSLSALAPGQYFPYKRVIVTLNKAVINYLPRFTFHLLYCCFVPYDDLVERPANFGE